MAEAILRRDLADRGVGAHVSSAGLLYDGRPAAEEVIELMDARSLDVRPHESRKMTAAMLAGSDLIIGMAREHVREAALLQPARFPQTFTLKELVRRGGAIGPRPAHESVEAWLERASAGRRPTDYLGSSESDDIADPMGRRFGVFKKSAVEIETLTASLVDLLWNPAAVGRS